MNLSIYSPHRRVLEKAEVDAVTLTGSEGEIQILPGHANMIGTLEPGRFSFRRAGSGEEVQGFISTGFFECIDKGEGGGGDKGPEKGGDGQTLFVIAETLELATEINKDRARDAEKRAQEKLADLSLSAAEREKYQRKQRRAFLRQTLN